jgi:Ran GTPase-activating protein (RanGAP) involved in mRNA processing and transport
MPPRARRRAAATTAAAASPEESPAPAAAVASLDSLPDAVLAHVLLALPLDARLRCAAVSRRFAALLRDASLMWRKLSFEGASPETKAMTEHACADALARARVRPPFLAGVARPVSGATLGALCARAGAALRVLDITARSCDTLTAQCVLRALQHADAAAGALEELHAVRESDCEFSQRDEDSEGDDDGEVAIGFPRVRFERCVFSVAEAHELLDACGALRRGALHIDAPEGDDAAAALRALPPDVRVMLRLHNLRQAPALPAALAAGGGATLAGLHVQRAFDGVWDAAAGVAPALAALPALRSLRLFGGAQGGDVAAALVSLLLPGGPPLRELAVVNSEVTPAGAVALTAALAANTSLRRLLLEGCLCGVDAGAALATALARPDATLTHLQLINVGLTTDAAFAPLAAALEHNRSVRTLSLCNNPFLCNAAGEALAASLAHNSTLRVLRLANTTIGDAGWTALAHALAHAPGGALRTLDARRLGAAAGAAAVGGGGGALRAGGAAALARLLATHRGLRTLHLDGSALGGARVAALARGLGANTGLLCLGLASVDAGDDGAAALAAALTRPRRASAPATLSRLSLKNNALTACGAASLARALAGDAAPTLNRLSLNENQIGDAGAKAIAAALSSNTTLTHLCMSWTSFTAAGAAALGRALAAGGTRLVHLDVSFNYFGDAGAKAFGSALAANVSLTTLDVHGCDVGNAGARALARGVAANATLRELDASENDELGDAGADALRTAMRRDNAALRRLLLGPEHTDELRDVE